MKLRVLASAMLAGMGYGVCIAPVIAQEVGATFPIVTPDDAQTHGLKDLRSAVQSDGGVPLPNLSNFIQPGANRKLEQLGKLFFYDQSIGSNGQSCATCHFHAGVDNRTVSLVSPGLLRVENNRDGDIRGYHDADSAPDVNFDTADPGDAVTFSAFPLVRNPGNVEETGTIVSSASGNSNDAISSPGVIKKRFEGSNGQQEIDDCSPSTDAIFHNGLVNQRRVPPRNSPTVINAVFNAFNFHDGRANHFFNGENPFGKMYPQARVLKNDNGDITPVKIMLPNSSLASQAVGPPNSDFEEACGDAPNANARTFPEIGKKMLRADSSGVGMRALKHQSIHLNDSLIGEYSRGSTTNGASITYRELIKQTFKEEWWRSDERRILLGTSGTIGVLERPSAQSATIVYPLPDDVDLTTEEAGSGVEDTVSELPGDNSALTDNDDLIQQSPRFTLMEANMALFFGLAVQAYEATLVSDDTHFDRWMRGDPTANFGTWEKRGLNVFVDKGKCINCHAGPELTNASVRNFQQGNNLIEPMIMGDNNFALYDNGFYNIGVTPTVEDIGRGGKGPLNTPLASSRQLLFKQALNINIPHEIIGENGVAAVTDTGDQVCASADADGRCTSPVNENFQRAAVDGAFKTPGLRNRELQGPFFHNGSLATLAQVVEFYDNGGNFCGFNSHDLDPDITPLGLSRSEKFALVRFLQSLTDERVRWLRAPFDRPSLTIPSGGNEHGTTLLRAVGRDGAGNALGPFMNLNQRLLGDMPTSFECSSEPALP